MEAKAFSVDLVEARCEQLEADYAGLAKYLDDLHKEVMTGSHRKARDLVRTQELALSDNPGAALLAERDRLVARVGELDEAMGKAVKQWRWFAKHYFELTKAGVLDGQKEPD